MNKGRNNLKKEEKGLGFPISSDFLDFDNIDISDGYIIIPYQDKDGQLSNNELLQQSMFKIAEQTDFVIPDLKATKFNMVIAFDGGIQDFTIKKVDFEMIVVPPTYSDKEKKEILEDEDEDEMIENWLSIFSSADAYHNGEDLCDDNSVEMELDLNAEQKDRLEWRLGLVFASRTCDR